MKILRIQCRIDGIYFWGKGWKDPETALKWYSYLNKSWSSIFWKVTADRNSVYLVTTNGGGMIHPMDFDIVLKENGCHVYRYENGRRIEEHCEIEDLRNQIGSLVEYCGGTIGKWEVKEYEAQEQV